MSKGIRLRLILYPLLFGIALYGIHVYVRWEGQYRLQIPVENMGSIWKVWEPPYSKRLMQWQQDFNNRSANAKLNKK